MDQIQSQHLFVQRLVHERGAVGAGEGCTHVWGVEHGPQHDSEILRAKGRYNDASEFTLGPVNSADQHAGIETEFGSLISGGNQVAL